MHVQLYVQELMIRYGLRPHGSRAKIAKHLKVGRGAVERLMKGDVKELRLERISALCEWLLENVDPSRRPDLRKELPGALFRLAGLWELILRSAIVFVVLGEKLLVGEQPAPASKWVSSLDHTASTLVVEQLLRDNKSKGIEHHKVRFQVPDGLDGMSESPESLERTGRAKARSILDKYLDKKDITLVSIASQRGNPLTELLAARIAGDLDPERTDVAFQEQQDDPLPLYLQYRETDGYRPRSCFGGRREGWEDGLHYRTGKQGGWKHIPWDAEGRTAGYALVRKEKKRLEIALAGYSGEGTRYLAEYFCSHADEFWPKAEKKGVATGIFACDLRFSEEGRLQPEDTQVVEL